MLRVNWRIVMAPMPLVDDVVAHELCHLSGASRHDARFWAAVAGVLPDWEQRRALLRRRGAEFKLD
ncbi:MAG: M48 family metallopeptidase [Chloroflexota bacterium]|nr:M48 family metallopeptidase [Chloroflexota bacterium]